MNKAELIDALTTKMGTDRHSTPNERAVSITWSSPTSIAKRAVGTFFDSFNE